MVNITVNEKEYQLRLTAKSVCDIEERLKDNPLNVFMAAAENRMPKIKDIITILHGCLQELNHGISLDDTYRIYDDYCKEGGDIMQLIEVIVKCFEDGGFVPKGSKNQKN